MNNLLEEYKGSMASLGAQVAAINWESPQRYGKWLAQVHYIVRHSTRLLALAGAHCPLGLNPLHQRLIKHAAEEMGHDVLPLRDLATLGLKIDDFEELDETKALVDCQYESIASDSIFSFFGYILLLEGLAITAGKELLKRVEKSHGKKSAIFLRVHVEEDENHVTEAFGQIEGFNAEAKKAVLANLLESVRHYQRMLDAIAPESRGLKDALTI